MVPPPQKRIFLTKKRGWSKELSAPTRRKRVYSTTDHKKTRHNRYLEAFRATNGLANLSTDPSTKEKAKSDAKYFTKMLKKFQ